MKARTFIWILVVLFLAVSCSTQPERDVDTDELTLIRLPMGYIPNVQYAPFYAAVEKGFFAENGIELKFDYSYETDGVALVGTNEIQFSLVSGEQVPIARAEGLPIVYVMAWYEKYPIAVVAKTEQNVKIPQDLAGKRVALPGPFGANYVGLRALMGKVGLQESDIILESVGFTQVEVLATDTSEVVVVYSANEPVQLIAQGYDLDVILVSDYVDLVSNGLITNEITLAEDPELVGLADLGILLEFEVHGHPGGAGALDPQAQSQGGRGGMDSGWRRASHGLFSAGRDPSHRDIL